MLPIKLPSQAGFSLLQMVMFMVIAGILASYIVMKFVGSDSEARQKATNSVAASLTVASATNYRHYKAGSSKSMVVDNCTDVANALPSGKLPSGYTITSQGLSVDIMSTCTVTNPDGVTTATFTATGTN